MRCFILSATFAFWAVMMGLLYVKHVRPQVPPELADREIEAMFADSGPPPPVLRTIWLRDPEGGSEEDRLGAIETRYLRIGDGEIQVSDRAVGKLPAAAAALLGGPSLISYFGISRISRLKGLVEMDAVFSGLGREVVIHGARRGDYIEVEYSFSSDKGEKRSGKDVYPLEPGTYASTGLSPFRKMSKIEDGMEWQVAILDPSRADSTRPVLTTARVTGKKTIRVGGRDVETYEVTCLEGKAKAWYLADGSVVRERWLLLGTIPVTIQYEDPEKGASFFGRTRGWTVHGKFHRLP